MVKPVHQRAEQIVRHRRDDRRRHPASPAPAAASPMKEAAMRGHNRRRHLTTAADARRNRIGRPLDQVETYSSRPASTKSRPSRCSAESPALPPSRRSHSSPFSVVVIATALPSASTTEKCVVCGDSLCAVGAATGGGRQKARRPHQLRGRRRLRRVDRRRARPPHTSGRPSASAACVLKSGSPR